MDKEHVKGGLKEAEGRAKKAAGELAGDKKLKREGEADKAEGKIRKAVGDVKDAVKGKK